MAIGRNPKDGERYCNFCHAYHLAEEFGRGKTNVCLLGMRLRMTKLYKDSPKYRSYVKNYQKIHPEIQKKAAKRWRERNREYLNSYQREYYKRKKEKENTK